MLNAMLVTTAMLAARTPAPPLMPQKQGMGPALIVETSRMPVGNPKPIRKPAGASTRTQRPARTTRSAPSRRHPERKRDRAVCRVSTLSTGSSSGARRAAKSPTKSGCAPNLRRHGRGHADSARRPGRNDLALGRMPVTHEPLVAAVGQLVGRAAEQGRDFGLNRLPSSHSLAF